MPNLPAASLHVIQIAARRILCLGFVAGYVNAMGFLDLGGLYVAAMTGNTAQLGLGLARAQWPHALTVGTVLAAFFAGGLISSFIRRRLAHPAIELALMAVILLTGQLARLWMPHLVGLELALLATAMAMQGETLSRFGGLSIQTIVATNNLLKLADGLVARLLPAGNTSGSLIDLVLPGCAWIAYLSGAAGAACLGSHTVYPFLLPALLVVVTTIDLLFLAPDSA